MIKRFNNKIKNCLWQIKFDQICKYAVDQFKINPTNLIERDDVSVHFLTGKRQVLMTALAAKSFEYFSEVKCEIFFHDDGTLRSKDFRYLSKHFPSAKLLTRKFANDELKKRNLDPLLLRLRDTSPPFFLKLIDVFEFSNSKYIINIDSDILFFDKPKDLLDPENLSYWYFNRDIESAYILTEKEAESCFDIKLISRLNAGLWRAPSSAYSREFLKEVSSFSRFEEFRARRKHVTEQTSAVLMASHQNIANYLPITYDIGLRKDPQHSVCKHYVGAIRREFVKEGVPLLLSKLDKSMNRK
ncbi:hypothetical protein N9200_00660 [Akkermansiaceae bacterium]|nr:hypothetical protein [Akkermansiaceae bacterium]